MKLNSNTLIALAALVVSVCALFISVQEARIMRTQQRVSIYPHLEAGAFYNSEGFGLRVVNGGVGLAKIESIQVYEGDQYFNDFLEVVDHLMVDSHSISYNILEVTELNQGVLQAGERVQMFRLPWTEETKLLSNRIGRINYRVHYCSLLEDCWEINNFSNRPIPLEKLPKIDESKEFY